MSVGYFVKIRDNLIFVNDRFAIKVTDDKANVINGLEEFDEFVSATAVHDNQYLAIAYRHMGVRFYALM